MNHTAIMAMAGAMLVSSGVANAADKPKGDQCFRSESFQGFRPINDHAFNIRVNVNDYYRIELEGACPTLTYPDAMLVTQVRGSDLICGPLDWDLRVRENGPGGFAAACIVKSQRKLTPEDVMAMPLKEKP
jgi:hypothetical protein